MPSQPLPPDEDRRLQALERLAILDTPSERAFDAITRVAARHYDTSVSLVTFVDRHRQWFKACHGWNVAETPRELSFCAHAILADEPMIVPDAREDPRFEANGLVTGPPHIRFYAGAPLVTSDGYRLGTLCIIDAEPRHGVAREDLDVLVHLADVVLEQLELKLQNAQTFDRQKELEALVHVSQDGLVGFDGDGIITYANERAEHLVGAARGSLTGSPFASIEMRFLDEDGLPLPTRAFPSTRVLDTGLGGRSEICGVQRDDGSVVWLRVATHASLRPDGTVAGGAVSLHELANARDSL